MAGNPAQKQKLLMIAEILANQTDEEHPMTAEELVGELENRGIRCERKSVYGDIEVLRDFGLDILKTRSKKSGFYLVSREWQLAEVRLLTDAVLAAEFITPKKSRELTEKLKRMLSIHQAKEIDRQVFIENRKKEKNEEIYYNIDKLQTAIAQKRKIQCRYHRRLIKPDGTVGLDIKSFTISPYAMLWFDDRYYVIGNNEKYDNLMHLRLDRMKSVVITNQTVRPFEEVSEYRGNFDVADYARKIANAFGGQTETIELLCKNEFLEQAFDRFGDGIRIRSRPDGRFSFKTEAAVSEGLVADILKFGEALEVVRPLSLRKKVCEAVQKMNAIYNTGDES